MAQINRNMPKPLWSLYTYSPYIERLSQCSFHLIASNRTNQIQSEHTQPKSQILAITTAYSLCALADHHLHIRPDPQF